jgi:hypothetical protein
LHLRRRTNEIEFCDIASFSRVELDLDDVVQTLNEPWQRRRKLIHFGKVPVHSRQNPKNLVHRSYQSAEPQYYRPLQPSINAGKDSFLAIIVNVVAHRLTRRSLAL